jgi:hypothetical protein
MTKPSKGMLAYKRIRRSRDWKVAQASSLWLIKFTGKMPVPLQ